MTLPGDIAIEARGVTVRFRSYQDRPTTFKESLLALVRRGQMSNYSTFKALDNVCFSVKKGEVFGVMGSNGAGKSTLLRVLAGVLAPSEGGVEVNGSLDSFIKLGAGFDADLNAIENIYLNGALHKKSRTELREAVPRILEFAELTDVAHKPIKYYSSGMYARLGFSTAIERDPDILLVDEILGVGDERFFRKCNQVFESFIARKKTVVIVSHGTSVFEKLAHRTCLLSQGSIVFIGDSKTAIEKYRDPSYQTAMR